MHSTECFYVIIFFCSLENKRLVCIIIYYCYKGKFIKPFSNLSIFQGLAKYPRKIIISKYFLLFETLKWKLFCCLYQSLEQALFWVALIRLPSTCSTFWLKFLNNIILIYFLWYTYNININSYKNGNSVFNYN